MANMKGQTLMAWMGEKNTILKEEDNISRTSGGLIALLVELIMGLRESFQKMSMYYLLLLLCEYFFGVL